jgi:hypothetical protein
MPLLITLSPRWPGGEGRVRGAVGQCTVLDAVTLPSLRDGPLPLPQCGRGAILGKVA